MAPETCLELIFLNISAGVTLQASESNKVFKGKGQSIFVLLIRT